MSANVTQNIGQQVNNLAQLITGLSLPAPTQTSRQEPPDNTLPTLICTEWLTGQLKLRSQAWRLINPAIQQSLASSQHQPLMDIGDDFRRSMARDITLSDIPHYRDLELNPDPSTISTSEYNEALLKYIRAHFAALNAHGTHPADPRHPSLLRRYREQDRLRNQTLIAILLPPDDADEADFRLQFESQYGREPQPEDIPRWPDIPYILPDIDPITEQAISNYHQTIRSIMLSQPIPHPQCDPPSPSPSCMSSSRSPPSPPQNPPPLQPTPPNSPPLSQTSHPLPTSSTGRVSIRSSPDPSDARRAKARTGKSKPTTRGACCNGHCQARLPYNAPTCTRSGHPMHASCAQPEVSPPICIQCYAISLDLTDI